MRRVNYTRKERSGIGEYDVRPFETFFRWQYTVRLLKWNAMPTK